MNYFLTILVTAVLVWSIQDYRMRNFLSEQKINHDKAVELSNSKHKSEIADLRKQFASAQSENTVQQQNLYSQAEQLKTDYENELENIQKEQANEISTLEKEYRKALEREVEKNGFNFVFGTSPTDPNKEKVKQSITHEFLLILHQKCTLHKYLYYETYDAKFLKEELARINEKLAFMRGLAKRNNFQIPRQDGELNNKIKNLGKSDQPMQCN